MTPREPIYICTTCGGAMFACRKCGRTLHAAMRVELPDEHNLCSDCTGATLKRPDQCVHAAVFA